MAVVIEPTNFLLPQGEGDSSEIETLPNTKDNSWIY